MLHKLLYSIISILLVLTKVNFAQTVDNGKLSGSVVDQYQKPISGCVITLEQGGHIDTTRDGNFLISDLPVDVQRPGMQHNGSRLYGSRLQFHNASEGPVNINIYNAQGTLTSRVLNTRIPGGTYTLEAGAFTPGTDQGMYLIRVQTSGYSTTHRFFPSPGAGASRARPVISQISPETHSSIIDTLSIQCPDCQIKKVAVNNYNGSLGKIAVTQSTNAANFTEVVFVMRNPVYEHWYANFGHYAYDAEQKVYGKRGFLCKLNVNTGQVTILLKDLEGCFRDPVVNYEGTRILFSWRKGGTDYFHLYEMSTDGTDIKQLTSGPYDDIEPCYLPDGGIVFCSSRANRFVNCWMTQVATIHRCDGDGTNIRMLSANVEHDNTPWVLPDGRILYTRWEYVDRGQMAYHHLWTMNPDGTNQMTYYGNMHPWDVYCDAKPIPGTDKIIMINGRGHGRPEHMGRITIKTAANGPDDKNAERFLSESLGKLYPFPAFHDPYPLSPDSFLVAQDNKILLMRNNGKYSTLFEATGELYTDSAMLCEPRPIIARTRETNIPSRLNPKVSTGKLILLDTYIGRNMTGVEKGDIKKLLILETLPKPINVTGGMEPLTMGGSFTLNRVLGTVPVEDDGSAYMEIPANRSIFLVALDENDKSVKRMQSFLTVMPGEVTSCIGCHEDRTMVVQNAPTIKALQRKASIPEPVPDMPQVFDYPRDIQPLWDKHCLSCHDVDKRDGGVLMTGDAGPVFTHSYYSLSTRLQIADGRNHARGNLAPRTIGSSASPLMNKVDGTHYGVILSDTELRKVKLWLDASATFPGTYAALGTGMVGGYLINAVQRPDLEWSSTSAASSALSNRCGSCHKGNTRLPQSVSDDMGLEPQKMAYNEGRDTEFGYFAYSLPWLIGNSTGNYAGSQAVDGQKDPERAHRTEWASKSELNPWITLTWSLAQEVNKVVLHDRQNEVDKANGGVLSFSDGSQITVSGLPGDGGAKEFSFTTKTITWVKFQVQGGEGQNVGLAEMEVYATNGDNVARRAIVEVSSFQTQSDDPYTIKVGSNAWMKKYADQRMLFAADKIFNLTRPEKSVALLAPLAVSAGGYGICGSVFTSTADADYQKILAMINEAKSYLEKITRFDMDSFTPSPHYIREMKRYGVLPDSYQDGSPIDVYELDQKYWESHWWKPEMSGTSVMRPH
ncbi:MAG: hypothetical protein HQK83_18715 [Fibrobacteria bacterium]|nr:hypothetical protein [Fibrobacteria bacterium]